MLSLVVKKRNESYYDDDDDDDDWEEEDVRELPFFFSSFSCRRPLSLPNPHFLPVRMYDGYIE